jgi:hypothetical protein
MRPAARGVARGVGLAARPAAGLLGQGRGHVLVDQVLPGVPLCLLAQDLVEAGVRGPVTGGLSRRRDHRGHQGQHRDPKARSHQRRGESAERLGGDHQVAPEAQARPTSAG